MSKGLGIAALIIVILAIFAPLNYGLYISGIGLALAAAGALAGDKIFAVATPLVAAVNVFFLSPIMYALLKDQTSFWVLTIAFLAAPFAGIALNSAGLLTIGKQTA
jgi:hypothetical protein